MKRVLIACEYSGTVRDAFSRRGWDAWSCDLLPTESELTRQEGKHIQGDVTPLLKQGWDLLIGHPPCNFISYAGMGAWNRPNRSFERLKALEFFATLWEAPIPFIALENPKSCASPVIAKYSQEVQPYHFGEPHIKTTWLWLRNLPPLKPTNILPKPEPLSVDNTERKKKRYFTDSATRDPKDRAKFWMGIAEAMADQWTEYINSLETNKQ
ncbi:MAG: hypothetical protein RR555_05455 [Bacteroidales bacterium]